MRSHSYVVNKSHNNNNHPIQHKSINKIILNIKLVLNIIIQYKTSLFKSATHSTQTKMQLNDNEVKLFQVTLIGFSHVYFSYAS